MLAIPPGMVRDAMDKAAEQSLRAGPIIKRLRDFMDAHGGVIAATPNEGGGTVFRFALRTAKKGEIDDAA